MQPLIEVCVKVSEIPCEPNAQGRRIVFGIGPFEEDDMPSIKDSQTVEHVARSKPLVGEFTVDMKVNQRTTVRVVKVLDAKGNEIPREEWGGDPVFGTDTPDLITLTPGTDATVARAVGPTGAANVKCTVGAATGAIDITLLSGPAAEVVLAADPPVDDASFSRRTMKR